MMNYIINYDVKGSVIVSKEVFEREVRACYNLRLNYVVHYKKGLCKVLEIINERWVLNND